MGTNNITIQLYPSVDVAPKYSLPEFKSASLNEACIVKNGTVAGNKTVDLIFTDDATGQKYIAMITGNILKNVASIITGA